jgi:acetyl esterase/lipase
MAWGAATLYGADQPETINVWPEGAPGEDGSIGEEKAETGKGDNIIRIGNVSKPILEIHRPSKETDVGTAVIICPGGGYNILAWNLEGTEVADWLNSVGVTGIVLKYRVPTRKGQEATHLAQLQDAQRALSLVRSKAKDWGIAPDRVGILGFSAGGHLAAHASTHHAERSYTKVDAADEQSCRPDFTVLIYPAYLVQKNSIDLAPEIKVDSSTPPAFMAHTEDDPVTSDSSLFYFRALKNNKIQGELHVYPTGGHGYGLRPKKDYISTWPKRAEDWLRSRGLLEKK